MLNLKIAFDLDNVILDMTPIFRRAFKDQGLEFFELPTTWEMSNYPKFLVDYIYKLFKDKNYMCSLPYTDDLNVLKEFFLYLKEIGIDLYIITHRPDDHKDLLEKRFNSDFHGIFKEIVVCQNKKSEELIKRGIKIIVDDAVYNIEDCLENNIVPFLVSNIYTPYNNHYINLISQKN